MFLKFTRFNLSNRVKTQLRFTQLTHPERERWTNIIERWKTEQTGKADKIFI